MKKIDNIKKNLSQIAALTEKNIKLNLRFKFVLIISYITPVVLIIMPLIVMGTIFEYNDSFGPWTAQNYLVFMFLAYNIYIIRGIINQYPSHIRTEKYWQTIPALIIAPFNRFNLLFGIFFSHLILISIPFAVFFIICYIIYPISIITVLSVLTLFFIMALIFSGIGLIMGIFALSNENIWKILMFIVELAFWASCITYPFEMFPEILQNVISLNPLYYIFDFLRFAWIENDIIITISTHSIAFSMIILSAIILPCLGVITFNYIFKKYGIVGY